MLQISGMKIHLFHHEKITESLFQVAHEEIYYCIYSIVYVGRKKYFQLLGTKTFMNKMFYIKC